MITEHYLSWSAIDSGQLGSQMNNFAMLYILSKISGHSVSVLTTEIPTDPTTKRYGHHLFLNGFDAPVFVIDTKEVHNDQTKIVPLYSIPVDQPIPIDTINKQLISNKNFLFVGLFHATFLYFLDQLNDLKNNFFKFKQIYIETGNKWLKENKSSNKKHISVHFRRTDYLACAAACCSDNYYKKALLHFKPDEYKLLVFSDDINYCKENREYLFDNFEVCFSENQKQYTDMYIMTQCDVNIIANSSFSLWGAILNNPNNLMVYPQPMLPSYMDIPNILNPHKSHIFVEDPYSNIN